ncbi:MULTISPECIES: ParB N-terminal domain-containing protein [unclassified Streptomyces]|uniref:ParB N-terminal domain-containing protein n=1 Tax=unclassified Streptomyces TaxID=2593676 RepID=UPI002E137B3E|nr:ParB N-terminal domain-containing protein [Streptomyces sp. NBC_01201]
MTDTPLFRPRLVRRDPRQLTRLEVNARFMRQEEYDRLVENVRRDGCLTSTPLIYAGGEYDEGRELVLSGNHRTMASIDAGLGEIDCMLIEEALTRQQLVAIQLLHNAIAGEDDPATIKQLYEELDDVDWRAYSGLDDDQLKLLAEVSPEGLSEANLDFATVSLIFLPAELEAARTAFEEARLGQNESWADQGFKNQVVLHGAGLGINVEIVERDPQVKGFVPQPKRWRVEQTYGILILHRRLVRDYEHRSSSASRVYWVMTHVVTRRLTGVNAPTRRAMQTVAA